MVLLSFSVYYKAWPTGLVLYYISISIIYLQSVKLIIYTCILLTLRKIKTLKISTANACSFKMLFCYSTSFHSFSALSGPHKVSFLRLQMMVTHLIEQMEVRFTFRKLKNYFATSSVLQLADMLRTLCLVIHKNIIAMISINRKARMKFLVQK